MTKRQLIQQAIFLANNPEKPIEFHPDDLKWLMAHQFSFENYKKYNIGALIIKESERAKFDEIAARYDHADKRFLVIHITEPKEHED